MKIKKIKVLQPFYKGRKYIFSTTDTITAKLCNFTEKLTIRSNYQTPF